ncbi:hypothetical protein TCA2_4417 [Paenibacillus sp. TCA20]|uniref:hypothetical protein n=1 Tax=Paenibacillus sp. TCA20 TaxID=1499968 RepID=UPI0004D5A56D|nr:hypothetical protein [Paenibacillus sp. TCA20]GAK41925.1 hypothetical protein TCA2_4417 [Paenibacillus sp. TCA20]
MNEEVETIGDYLERMITEGYIDKDCRPIKCHICENTDIEGRNYMYEDFALIIEYEMFCKPCNVSIGRWSYGNWEA